MSSHSEIAGSCAVIRFGRSMQLSWGLALGVSLAVALNTFVLVGWITNYARTQAPLAYGLSLLLFLPMVLTYVERAVATPSSRSGIFNLVRADGSDLRSFAVGWLLLMGYLSLTALLGWGAGLCLSILAQYLLKFTIAARWLALASILLIGFNNLIGTSSAIRSLKANLVYGCLIFILAITAWVWLSRTNVAPMVWRQPVTLWGVVAFLAPGLWGIAFLLDYRQRIRQPRKDLLLTLLVPFILGGVLGAVVSAAGNYPHLWADSLNAPGQLTAPLSSAFLEIIFVIVGLLVNFVALGYVLSSGLGLIKAMIDNGFLPEFSPALHTRFGKPVATLALGIATSALMVISTPTSTVIGLAGLGFLWVTALVNGPDLFQLQARLLRKRSFQLPFYPLFPGLATAIGVLLSFALPPMILVIGGVWMLLGGIFYVIYARRRNISLREEHSIFREEMLFQPQVEDNVMVAITNPYTSVPLIRAGAKLVKPQGGRLIVLHVLTMSERSPQKLKQFKAQQQLQAMEEYVQRARIDKDILVIPFVRVSKDAALGIIDTTREEKVDLLLLGWEESEKQQVLERVWERAFDEAGEAQKQDSQESGNFDPLLDRIVRTVSCDIVIMQGQLPNKVERVLVPVGGSSHTSRTLGLGQRLVKDNKGQVVALHVTPAASTPRRKTGSLQKMPSLLLDVEDTAGIEQRTVRAANIKAGILKEARDYDIVLMTASKPSLLEENIFDGLPTEVAQARAHRQPTMLIKPFEGAYRLWLRGAWYSLSAFFPTLTTSERTEISVKMRQAAQPSIDFFVLIILAATIATLGLLQNSAAVIIGAMLVAPLMSPIVAMAMGIVEGDMRLIRVAAEAASKGIALAISVGMIVTLISPEPHATSEIVARTHPNLLDLVVALTSGAAAGYALCRKEVSAALPGVAIAVALVPPLCVVGYGVAASYFEIAGGSLLLFMTNLIAIILAAAIVFLLLGFRPLSQYQGQFQRGLTVSIVSLVLIAIPLAILLNISLSRFENQRRQNEFQHQAEDILETALPPDTARVAEVTLEYVEDGAYIAYVTIYEFADLDTGQIEGLEALLNTQMNLPITLQVTLLKATLKGRQLGPPVSSSP